MGKLIGSIDKHSLCAGTPNELPIRNRLKELKDTWNKSVKASKDKSADLNQGVKRKREDTSSAPSPTAKKPLLNEKKKSSLNSLLKRVSPGSMAAKPTSSTSNTAQILKAVGEAMADGKPADGTPKKSKL